MSKLLRIGPAAEFLGVSVGTLRRWEDDGRITPERTPSGQRMYRDEDLRALQAGGLPKHRARPAAPAPAAPSVPNELPNAPRARPAPKPPKPRRPMSELFPDASADLRMMIGEADWYGTGAAAPAELPDVGELLDELPDEAPPAPPARPRPPRRAPDEPARRVLSARAAVEVERAGAELDELTAQREDARAAREAAQRERDRTERAAAAAAAERARLDELRAAGRKHATTAGAPADVVADVTGDLAAYVTAARFPAYLGADEAAEQVRARVERLLKPWRDEQARERAREQRRANVAALLARGESWAMLGTIGAAWDAEARAEARAEVKEVLAREVRGDWTEADVRARVDELLAEWEDEDEEDDE